MNKVSTKYLNNTKRLKEAYCSFLLWPKLSSCNELLKAMWLYRKTYLEMLAELKDKT